MRITTCIVAAVLISAVVPRQAAADAGPESNRRDDQYYTEAEAREKVFGRDPVWRDTAIHVDSSARAALHAQTGLKETDSLVRLAYSVDPNGRPEAVYRVASEVGKHNPFEFLVGLDARLEVKGIVVLNYRESRGGDVRRGRFLGQFKGKGIGDDVRVSNDIVGISGATLSSRAVTRGVRKTIWWAHQVWPTSKGVSR